MSLPSYLLHRPSELCFSTKVPNELKKITEARVQSCPKNVLIALYIYYTPFVLAFFCMQEGVSDAKEKSRRTH